MPAPFNPVCKNLPLCHETIFTMAGKEKETIIASLSFYPAKNGNVTPNDNGCCCSEVLALKHKSRILVSGLTLYLVQGRAMPVLHGPNSTESNLFHHGETT